MYEQKDENEENRYIRRKLGLYSYHFFCQDEDPKDRREKQEKKIPKENMQLRSGI